MSKGRNSEKKIYIYRQRETDRQTDRDRERDRDRQTESERGGKESVLMFLKKSL